MRNFYACMWSNQNVTDFIVSRYFSQKRVKQSILLIVWLD